MRQLLISLFLFIAIPLSLSHAFDNKATNPSAETVVLIHGLGRSNSAMWLIAKRLKDAGFNVERVGYASLNNTPEKIQADVNQQINACCSQREKTVHFVGHSLGGLVIRAYLGENEVKNLGKVVLIGTPSNGTPVVDIYKDKWWMKLAGDTALALGTDNDAFPQSLPKPHYPLGIIAGDHEKRPFSKRIPGADDGLVAVDSTLVEGMTDFIVLPTSHTMMKYNKAVFKQTLHFLNNGRFMR